ncbi:glycerol-3-phosphate dehydrogenase (NAD(P)+) [Apibacter mensalis]|uniref:Glycerol-3-phosphate dehydrogenase n=1 Tax=Apibacter mensalis TaxID=1586267 RepID=A0A0X3ANV7_9FLAO|nr:glycerol-3-phosphate dehydrogenase [Apibacter mensalis]CVK15923.1 glycerol-3-phosphate dehydrogenase (NAD(P)+) [Apibacter mensalis]
MAIITILGAGAMGSALCTPVCRAGWEVRLWGTWLDGHLLDVCEAGKPHPRTQIPLEKGVKLYRSNELNKALEGADVVVMSVASVGVPKVTELALKGISQAKALWLTSKGFCPDKNGKIQLLPEAIRIIAKQKGVLIPPIVAIAGPVKANECAEGKPTATIFGCKDLEVSRKYAQEARTEVYCIEATDDEIGVEICAPMKNVYAIALGIADGLEEGTGFPHHNLKAATFSRAIKEMSLLGQALGARMETAFGLPGVGDLEVTGLSGRNKVYGVRIGRGESAKNALAEMNRLEQTVEGVPAASLAAKLVEQSAPHLKEKMTLLQAVNEILAGTERSVVRVLSEAVLPQKP